MTLRIARHRDVEELAHFVYCIKSKDVTDSFAVKIIFFRWITRSLPRIVLRLTLSHLSGASYLTLRAT